MNSKSKPLNKSLNWAIQHQRASRLGVSAHSLYAWKKRFGKPEIQRTLEDAQEAELKRLRQELKRVTEERDILKKAATYFAKASLLSYYPK